MLLGKVHSHLHCVSQSHGVVDGGSGVVGVAGPVDLAALTHHEEAVVVVQHLDALLHVVSQRPHVLGAVQLVGHGVAVGQILVHQNGLLGISAHSLGLLVGHGHGVAGFLGQIIQVVLVLLFTGGRQQAAAGKVVKVGGDQLLADLIVVVAAGLVGVESRGSGVVEVDGRDDTDFPVFLVLKLLGNGLIGSGAGLVHVDGAGIGLVSGGNGRGGGGGVGAEAVGVVSNSGTYRLKIHKVEVLRAIQLGALVVVQAGLSLPVVLVLQSAQIVRSGLDLGIAHTVADEQEHILGRLHSLGLGHLVRIHRILGAGIGSAGAARQRSGSQSQSQSCGNQFFHGCFPSNNLLPYKDPFPRSGKHYCMGLL